MKPFKPDLIVANCPGCSMFLDKWQYALSEMEGTTYDDNKHGIPVVTHEELAAIMLGFNPWELGLQMHQVQVDSLFKRSDLSTINLISIWILMELQWVNH